MTSGRVSTREKSLENPGVGSGEVVRGKAVVLWVTRVWNDCDITDLVLRRLALGGGCFGFL